MVFAWIWCLEGGRAGYRMQMQPSPLVGPVWAGGRLPEPGLGCLGVESADFGDFGCHL